MNATVSLRDLKTGEPEALYRLFVASVHGLAHSAYEPAQLHAWAPLDEAPDHWRAMLLSHRVRIAEVNGRRAGFLSFEPPDEVGMLYVLPAYVRQGIASALYTDMEMYAFDQGLRRLRVDASHLARPFFAAHGFVVLGENRVERAGVVMSNWGMEKAL